jgi:hypothetical protein
MKRITLVTALLLGGAVIAQADTSVYISKPPRGDADLQAATQYCDLRVGPVKNGANTTAKYKSCLQSRGRRYRYTTREKTWIDPDTGDTCHGILGGLGSSCGNF